uniref:Tr-type G domain-containing protein n=1 Tax=Oryza meridionalis TaxID=40149 RepID=A0A0E0DK64_9ORYZ
MNRSCREATRREAIAPRRLPPSPLLVVAGAIGEVAGGRGWVRESGGGVALAGLEYPRLGSGLLFHNQVELNMVDSNPDSDDNRSDPQEPSRNPGMWQCTICEHGNDAKKLSCEQCGVLRDFSLYFNNALEVDGRAKRRDKRYAVSVLARTLFLPSSAKSKDVLSGGFKASRNPTGNTRATLDALHKTYMTRKERHINIVPFKFDTPSPDDVVATGLKSSRSFRKGIISAFPHPHHLSLERKSQKSKANIKKPVSSSLYKPEPWMLQHEDEGIPTQLNLAIVGHVDSGKSTLCGRLLHALGRISKKQMHKYEKEAKEKGKGSFAYAWAMDESADERERGITMTVGVAYFDTKNYHVVLLDSPGHKDFVPNMISGATQSDAAILVIDASIGSFEAGMGINGIGQTKEHSQLVRSFGVDNLIVVVNKMDSVEYSKERFNFIKSQLGTFLRSCGYKDSAVAWVPISAMENENLMATASDTRLSSWYDGNCLLKAIDTLPPPSRDVSKPLRLPICDVFSSHKLGQVAIGGKVEVGATRSGSKILVMPFGELAVVKTIERNSSSCNLARAGDNVAIGLQGIDPSHVMPGGVICHPDYPVSVASCLELKILVLDITVPILVGLQFELHIHHAKVSASMVKILSLLEQKTGKASKKIPRFLTSRQTAVIEVKLEKEVCVEEFSNLKALGRVFLRSQGNTIAVGIVSRVRREQA